MKLGVFERLILNNILSSAMGDITTIRIVQDLREALSFSEEEHKALGLRSEGLKVFWDESADVEKEIEIGDKAHEIIVDCLKKLNRKEMLTQEHLPVWERFCEQ